jgi:hypothetical protein
MIYYSLRFLLTFSSRTPFGLAFSVGRFGVSLEYQVPAVVRLTQEDPRNKITLSINVFWLLLGVWIRREGP